MHFFKLSVPATAALASAAVITLGTPAHDVEITNPIGHINKRGSSDLIFLGNDDAGLLFTMSGPACILSSDTQVFGLSSFEWGCIRMDIKNRQSVMWMRGIKNSGRL